MGWASTASGRELVEHGAKFERVDHLHHLGWRRSQHGGRLVCVARGQQQLERPSQFAPPAVLLGRPPHGVGVQGRQSGQVVPHRPGQVPPRAARRGEGDARSQAPLEQAFLPGGQVHQLRVEQRQAGDLGQQRPARQGRGRRRPRPGWRRRRRSDGPGRWPLPPWRLPPRPCGPHGPRPGRWRRSNPRWPGRGLWRRAGRSSSSKPERHSAQRFVGRHGQVGRGELEVLRPAQPRGP